MQWSTDASYAEEDNEDSDEDEDNTADYRENLLSLDDLTKRATANREMSRRLVVKRLFDFAYKSAVERLVSALA